MVSRLETDGWTASEEAAFAKGDEAHEPDITHEIHILFDSKRRGGQGGSDVSVCFRRPDGSHDAIFVSPSDSPTRA